MRFAFAFAVAIVTALPAFAQASEDEGRVKAVIADWYQRVSQKEADAPYALMAPGAIDGGPGFSVPADADSGSRALRGPWLNNELAGRALKFSYDIDALTVDARFAKARVWERGYFYAWAAQTTYENAASTLFVLERQDDGRWLILAHEAQSVGIPPNKVTNPMPDLRADFYAGPGKDRDPEADANAAKGF